MRWCLWLLVLVVACNSSPSGGDAGADSGADSATDGPSGDASTDGSSDAANCKLTNPPASMTCATCMQANCCTAANSCAANPDCASYMACALACMGSSGGDGGLGDGALPDAQTGSDSGEGGGFACFKACQMKYPTGVNDGIVVLDCQQMTCAGQGCP